MKTVNVAMIAAAACCAVSCLNSPVVATTDASSAAGSSSSGYSGDASSESAFDSSAASFSAADPSTTTTTTTTKAAAITSATTSVPNWIGARDGDGEKLHFGACYRRAHFASNVTCPAGYEADKLGDCWANCPLAYPVNCGTECVAQGKSCGLDVVRKITSAVLVPIRLATGELLESFFLTVEAGVLAAKGAKKLHDHAQDMVAFVDACKQSTPNASRNEIQRALHNTPLVQIELPQTALEAAVNATSGNASSNAGGVYAVRDHILHVMNAVKDKILAATETLDEDDSSSTSRDDDKDARGAGQPTTPAEFALRVAKMHLTAISLLDPTGLAFLAKSVLQPICPSTAAIGFIDDGPAHKALGLTTTRAAFNGSSGEWRNAGDGDVLIRFASHDDQDVTVRITSNGQTVATVAVPAGAGVGSQEPVSWRGAIAPLEGHPLYLQRTHHAAAGSGSGSGGGHGFHRLGRNSTHGGGSLAIWVPKPLHDGHLELNVTLQATNLLGRHKKRTSDD